jgi:hypothetical protein
MTIPSELQGIFYAADLPLSWSVLTQFQPAQAEQWQHNAVTLLRALAVFETPIVEADRDLSSVSGKTMERLEAKLDLVLSMIVRLVQQQDDLPPPRPVILHSNSLEWTDANVPEPEQLILLSLHLSPHLPQALLIPATVRTVERLDNCARMKADFTHLSQELEEWLERTLFRFHRRSIQLSHSRQHAG